jgi:hypothetical protein
MPLPTLNLTTSSGGPLPSHITASKAVLTNIKALLEDAKTNRKHHVVIGDSNCGSFSGTGTKFKRDNFVRQMAIQTNWLINGASSGDAMEPLTQTIHFAPMGLTQANAVSDLPWHVTQRRWIGDMCYFAGPLSNPSPSVGGLAQFSGNSSTGVDSIAVNNRLIGFIIDRTATGEPWEKNMTRVALGYWAGSGQPTIASTTYAKINGTSATVSFSGAYSSFTFELRDLTGIDLSGIPSTGWDATDAACIAIKAAVNALTPYATRTVTAKGSGAAKPGMVDGWLDGILADKKTLVTLKVADGTIMGAAFETLTFDNGVQTAGMSFHDHTFSGHAYQNKLERIRCDADGVDVAGWSNLALNDFITTNYVYPGLIGSILKFGENTYARASYFGGNAGPHLVMGLDMVTIALLPNDINQKAIVLYRKISELIAEVIRVNPNAIVQIVIPPCPAANPTRDGYYLGTIGPAETYAFRQQRIKEACALYPSNTVVIDLQQYYGNLAPTVLKGRLGHLGLYSRQTGDPIDPLHMKSSTYTSVVAAQTALIYNAAYIIG